MGCLRGTPRCQALACCDACRRLRAWTPEHRGKHSRHNELAKAKDYTLERWEAFTWFPDDGRICLTNNAAERARRPRPKVMALRRQQPRRRTGCGGLLARRHCEAEWRRPGLADPFARITDYTASRLHELLPWNWKAGGKANGEPKAAIQRPPDVMAA